MDHAINNSHIWFYLKHKSDESISTSLHGRAALGASTATVFPLYFEEQNVFVHHIKNIFAFRCSLQVFAK